MSRVAEVEDVDILLISSEQSTVVGIEAAEVSQLASVLAATLTVTVVEVAPPLERDSRFRWRSASARGTSTPSVSAEFAISNRGFVALRERALSCDVLITAGWSALLACEEMRVMSDAHVMTDLDLRLDGAPARQEGDRKLELLNRARRILALSVEDVRRLRAFGRFPTLLLVSDGPDPESSARVSVIRLSGLTAWVRGIVPRGHAEEDLGEVLRQAAPRSIPDLAGLLDACLDDRLSGRIQTLNLQHLWLARKNAVFKENVASADAITADGWPIVRLLDSAGHPVQRVTGSDLVPNLLSDPRFRGLRLALIGGAEAPGSAFEHLAAGAGAAVVLREHGDRRDWDPLALAETLNLREVHLALIAVTQPAGDLLVAELTAAGYRGTAIGIGASVDLFVGGERRAAPWVQDLRLEWMFRFLQDPRRLWRRYFLEGIPTYVRVVRPMLRQRTLAKEQDSGGGDRADSRRGRRGSSDETRRRARPARAQARLAGTVDRGVGSRLRRAEDDGAHR